MPLEQLLAEVIAKAAIDDPAALDRRALADLLGPAQQMRIFVRLEEFGRVIDLPGRDAAIPGPDRDIGDRIVAARHIRCPPGAG